MKRLSIALSLVVVLIGMFGTNLFFIHANASPTPIAKSDTATIPFIENVGQFGAGARFRTNTEYGTLFLAENALWFTILEERATPSDTLTVIEDGREHPIARGGVNVRLSFVGANPHPVIEAFDPLTASINYFYGNDPAKWYTYVPVWGGVRYKDLYPGIDLELTSNGSTSVQRVVVHEGAEAQLAEVQLQIEGADAIRVGGDRISFTTAKGGFVLPLLELVASPAAKASVSSVMVEDNRITMPFRSAVEQKQTFIPDTLLPSNLLYSTLIGGSDGEIVYDLASDRTGAIYMSGLTESRDFPVTPGVFDPIPGPSAGAYEGFVTKLNASGTALVYSTYVHGNDIDYLESMVLDGEGSVYVTGQTLSSDFPTTPNPPAPGPGGTSDGFVFKLSPDGAALVYSFYLGGSDTDFAEAIALGPDKSVTIVGTTASTDFPTTPNAYDTTYNGYQHDVFVTRVNPDGTTLAYSTFLGGWRNEEGKGVAIDASNAAYITGYTVFDDFPITPGAYDADLSFQEFFVTKFAPDGRTLVYSTFVGGSPVGTLGVSDIALDRFGAAYVTSSTTDDDFPATPGAYDTECGEGGQGCEFTIHDGVLFKLNPTGSDLVYGTYLGGRGGDTGNKVAVDYDGNAYVLGKLGSTDFLVTPGGYLPPAAYLAGIWKISADGSRLLHLSRVPGEAQSGLYLEAPDVILYSGSVYQYYETTPGAYDSTLNGLSDAGVGRLALPAAATSITLTQSSGTLISVVDGTEYTFAPNTFDDTVVLTHAPRHRLSLPPIAPRVAVGHTFVNYAIASDGTTALQPTQRYHLTISYNPATLGATEASLRLYFWNGSAWEVEPTMQLFTDQNTITADPDRLGWWIVSGVIEPHYYYLPIIRH